MVKASTGERSIHITGQAAMAPHAGKGKAMSPLFCTRRAHNVQTAGRHLRGLNLKWQRPDGFAGQSVVMS